MAEFTETTRQWRRMCKVFSVEDHECEGCPLRHITENACGAIFEAEFADVVDWHELEERVMAWAAEHPEPVYPTWGDYITKCMIHDVYIGKLTDQQTVLGYAMYTPIPADIAQKLGIEPKE